MAGADYHAAAQCPYPQFIRPVLFAVFKCGPTDLKAFLKDKLGDQSWDADIKEFERWLTKPPGNGIPNHLRMYWWILKFWGKLD